MVHSKNNVVKWPDTITNDFIRNIINAFPYDIHALYELVQVYEIVYSKTVPTAAMQVIGIPRILINKDWVDEWAYTWSDMVSIIHHEITHRMLLHVREDLDNALGAKLTHDQMNFLLDIRVQGLTYQMLPEPVYQAFWNRYYAKVEYPMTLLASGSKFETYQQRQMHKEIFSPFGVSLEQVARFIFGESMTEFQDMSGAGESGGKSGENGQGSSSGGNDLQNDKDGGTGESSPLEQGHNDPNSDTWTPFVGNHDKEQEDVHMSPEETMNYADKMRETIEKKVEKAQKQKDKEEAVDGMVRKSAGATQNIGAKKDYGSGGSQFLIDLDKIEDYYHADEEMKRKMMIISVESEELKAKKALKALFPDMPTPTVRPNFRDKRAVALYSRGIWPVFFENNIEDPKGLCHIYIDDSGSQFDVIGFVVRLFSTMKDYLCNDVHFFSESIWTINKLKLKSDMEVETTGGTDMNCVIEHALKNKIQKCLVITDGYGPLSDDNALLAKRAGQKYLIGFTEDHYGSGFDAVEWKHFEIPKEDKDEQ